MKNPPVVHPFDLTIQEIPCLEFFEDIHKYRYKGEWVPYSMTQVCKGNDSFFKNTLQLPEDHPERVKLQKALHRGTTVHSALEAFNRGQLVPDETSDYQDWITPCINDVFWERWKPVPGGIELSLYDPRFKIAGKLDVILQNQETGLLALADYKTQGKRDAPPYNIRSQLGGYCNLADQMPETRGLGISQCFAIWVRPGKTEFQPIDAESCITEYLASRKLFFNSLPDF